MASGFDYDEVYARAQAELEELQKGKALAETALAEINERIEAVSAMIQALERVVGKEPFVDLSSDEPPSTLDDIAVLAVEYRVTSNIRLVLRSAEGGLSAPEIKAALQASGWDVSEYKNPLAFIHTVLKRLVEGGEAAELPAVEGTKKYRWVETENGRQKPEPRIESRTVSPRKRSRMGKIGAISRR